MTHPSTHLRPNDAFPPAMLQVGQDLHRFLEKLPAQVKRGRLQAPREECRKLLDMLPVAERTPAAPKANRLEIARHGVSSAAAKVRHSLDELGQALDKEAARRYLMAKYAEVSRAYESLRTSMRTYAQEASKNAEMNKAWADEAEHSALRPLVPLVGARTWFHIGTGLLAAVMYQVVFTRAQSIIALALILTVFGSLELTRRFSYRWNHTLVTWPPFAAIVRPREFYRVNSATWYVTALLLLTPLFSRPAVITGVLILALADPAAAWFGKRWGKRKLYGEKSVVGTLAFAGTALVVSAVYLAIFGAGLGVGSRIAAAFAASICGAIAEVATGKRLDDNLTIPIATVLAAAIFI